MRKHSLYYKKNLKSFYKKMCSNKSKFKGKLYAEALLIL